MLSYQHAFHAGNRADVLKHAVLDALLRVLAAGRDRVLHVETHAARGWYDLASKDALKKAEFREGVAAALAHSPAPPELAPWLDLVRAQNPAGTLARYPGSPALAALRLRASDRLVLFEKHPQEVKALEAAMAGDDRVLVRKADGFAGSLTLAPRRGEAILVHVDPSYETASDIQQVADWAPRAIRRWGRPVLAIWLPLFTDGREGGLVEALEAIEGGLTVATRWPLAKGAASALSGSAMWLWGLDQASGEQARRIALACDALWAARG